MKILNLTQHTPTPEQIAAGVVASGHEEYVSGLLTFATIPSAEEVRDRAVEIAALAFTLCNDAQEDNEPMMAMIGGAPFLMAALERELINEGITPLYAFSERVSVEEQIPDGSVKKTNIFKHVGFVSPNE